MTDKTSEHVHGTSEIPAWIADFFLENFSGNTDAINVIISVVTSTDGPSDYVKMFDLDWANFVESEMSRTSDIDTDAIASAARAITRADQEDGRHLLASDKVSAELAGMMVVVENRDKPGFFRGQIDEIIGVGGIPAVILLIQSEDDSMDILSTLLIADITSIEGFIHPGLSLSVPTSVQ